MCFFQKLSDPLHRTAEALQAQLFLSHASQKLETPCPIHAPPEKKVQFLCDFHKNDQTHIENTQNTCFGSLQNTPRDTPKHTAQATGAASPACRSPLRPLPGLPGLRIDSCPYRGGWIGVVFFRPKYHLGILITAILYIIYTTSQWFQSGTTWEVLLCNMDPHLKDILIILRSAPSTLTPL